MAFFSAGLHLRGGLSTPVPRPAASALISALDTSSSSFSASPSTAARRSSGNRTWIAGPISGRPETDHDVKHFLARRPSYPSPRYHLILLLLKASPRRLDLYPSLRKFFHAGLGPPYPWANHRPCVVRRLQMCQDGPYQGREHTNRPELSRQRLKKLFLVARLGDHGRWVDSAAWIRANSQSGDRY